MYSYCTLKNNPLLVRDGPNDMTMFFIHSSDFILISHTYLATNIQYNIRIHGAALGHP